MPTYRHPGVYVTEVPAARGISSASTSVAAFIGVAESGPCGSPRLITSWNAYTQEFGALTWHGFMPWAVYEFFKEGGTSCYIVRANQADPSRGAVAAASIGNMVLSAVTMGAWGNSLQVCINSAGGADQAPLFNLLVVVPESTIDPTEPPKDQATRLLIAYVKQNALLTTSINGRNYVVLESFGGFALADAALQVRINTQSMFIRASVTGSALPANMLAPVSFENGQDPTWDFQGALNSLAAVPALSLLAMPDIVGITSSEGIADVASQSRLVNEGLKFCEGLKSLFYVIDPPYGQDVPGILSFKNGTDGTNASQCRQPLDSSYGALYYPWVWILSPLSNTNVPIPPSGPALGRYANADNSIGVWKSPAGVNEGAMRTVSALFERLTDADQDRLNPDGINALRNLITYGNVIYGARTVSQDTQWTYLSVRRLFIFVEQSVKNSLQWVAFEPSDQRLWAAVTRDISDFLTTLWQQGALFAASAPEAFFVTCDASNNPPEARGSGELYIDIGLAPIYPAEFMIVRIIQKTATPDSVV